MRRRRGARPTAPSATPPSTAPSASARATWATGSAVPKDSTSGVISSSGRGQEHVDQREEARSIARNPWCRHGSAGRPRSPASSGSRGAASRAASGNRTTASVGHRDQVADHVDARGCPAGRSRPAARPRRAAPAAGATPLASCAMPLAWPRYRLGTSCGTADGVGEPLERRGHRLAPPEQVDVPQRQPVGPEQGGEHELDGAGDAARRRASPRAGRTGRRSRRPAAAPACRQISARRPEQAQVGHRAGPGRARSAGRTRSAPTGDRDQLAGGDREEPAHARLHHRPSAGRGAASPVRRCRRRPPTRRPSPARHRSPSAETSPARPAPGAPGDDLGQLRRPGT